MPKKKKKAASTHQFLSPESSNVEGGTWDKETGYTVIAFRDKKQVDAPTAYYYYEKVTEPDWLELVNSPSKGKHMRHVFRNKYKGVRLDT